MNQNEFISQALLNHFKKHPELEPRDAFKFLFQSIFGCEHMISSPEFVAERIKSEFETLTTHKEEIEPLAGNYVRLNLGILNSGLTPETLGNLFFLTAKKEKGTLNDLKNAIEILKKLTRDNLSPFSEKNLSDALNLWAKDNYPPIHHSDAFRANYKPAYRVISKDFIKFLPFLCEIDKKASKGNVIVAIEGSSASGKTTLGSLLKSIYDCNLFHMDDFFLQPHQRTNERLSTPGGNVDSERFLNEILLPLSKNEDINYSKFNCSKLILEKQPTVAYKKINIIEGAYSMHPVLQNYYDISVFLDISNTLQKERILKRNPDMSDRFFNQWIPMEHKYFTAFDIKQKCDFTIPVN